VRNGFVAPQSEKYFLSVKKKLLRVRIKASRFPDSLDEEHAVQKLSNQETHWETERPGATASAQAGI